MSTLDTAITLKANAGFAGTTGYYLTVNGSTCYAAGNGTKVTAVDLTNPDPGTNTTLLPFAWNLFLSTGSFTNDGTWFYGSNGTSIFRVLMTAVGVGGDPSASPSAGDGMVMTSLSSPAQFGPITTGPDGTLYVGEKDSSSGPYKLSSVLKVPPYTRTTLATFPLTVASLSVGADNVVWAMVYNSSSFTNYTLYKVSGGTATAWSPTSSSWIIAMSASGQYVYVTRYPSSGPYTTSKAIQVSRYAQAASGPYTDMCGGPFSYHSSGDGAGAGEGALFEHLRSITPYGTETMLVQDNGSLRALTSSAPATPTATERWGTLHL